MENTEEKNMSENIVEENEISEENIIPEDNKPEENGADAAEVKEEAAAAEAAGPQMKASTLAKREKKRERREAKAARKAANKVEEKKNRPNNIILGIMIFGVLIGMFAFVKGYNYFSKEASIESYIANNGGEETYGAMAVDEFTTANITAKKNSMKIVLNVNVGNDKDLQKQVKEMYKSEKGEEQLKYIGAYFLNSIKPQTRAFSADAEITAKLGKKEIASTTITYKEAEDIIENGFEHDHDEDADEAADSEDADDAGDDAEEKAED